MRGRVFIDRESFDRLSVFDDLDAIAGLADERAGIAADEGISADVFATFDGLKKKGFTRAADFSVSRKRRFNISQQTSRDGNQVALSREFLEFIELR